MVRLVISFCSSLDCNFPLATDVTFCYSNIYRFAIELEVGYTRTCIHIYHTHSILHHQSTCDFC